jgi:hypothetical protein
MHRGGEAVLEDLGRSDLQQRAGVKDCAEKDITQRSQMSREWELCEKRTIGGNDYDSQSLHTTMYLCVLRTKSQDTVQKG